MQELFDKIIMATKHLETLNTIFSDDSNFIPAEKGDFVIYKHNLTALDQLLTRLDIPGQLYSESGRQMKLADLVEYMFLARGYYSMPPKSRPERQLFVESVLRYVNLLMCYEDMTVSATLRQKYLTKLGTNIPSVAAEPSFNALLSHVGKIGLPRTDTEGSSELNSYFDTLLPKTAGGLWHELLVYVFILRSGLGYIVPLLLVQRFYSKGSSVIPPDFLIITPDRHLYGIEVGRKKEIQSGSFSLQTGIPTASLDTENSRVSDRCPICKRWIPFCDQVIKNYSDFSKEIADSEIRCLDGNCKEYSRQAIAAGECPYAKYSRGAAKTLTYAQHPYANGLHYHYQCVLSHVTTETKIAITAATDTIAIKTHYPFYSGLEALKR